MKSVYGPAKWERQAIAALGDKPLLKSSQWDTSALLSVMIGEWPSVFKRNLGSTERSIVGEMRDVRNKWAHQEPFSTDDTYRVFDNVHRLLHAIGAKEAVELERQKQELLRVRFEEQVEGFNVTNAKNPRLIDTAYISGAPGPNFGEVLVPLSGRERSRFSSDSSRSPQEKSTAR